MQVQIPIDNTIRQIKIDGQTHIYIQIKQIYERQKQIDKLDRQKYSQLAKDRKIMKQIDIHYIDRTYMQTYKDEQNKNRNIFRNRYYKGIFINIVDGRFTTEDCSRARKIMYSASI